jgi:mannose-6-phosphate isomerase-like protein (cupin superfamily)
MRLSNISDFKAGWFIGDFEPSLFRSPHFEVAHHFYAKGVKSTPHLHKLATEYNYIVNGSVKVLDKALGRGDVFIYEPSDVCDVEYLEDTDLLIIKSPSIPGDKYEV